MQTSKNIDLTQKLITYLVKGENVPDLPQDVSFVPFSKSDKQLNSANKKLLDAMARGEKLVAIANEPKTSKESWEIIPVNF